MIARGVTEVRFYCRCGAKWYIEDSDMHAVVALHDLLIEGHTGTGHGGTTAEVCRRARDRKAREPEPAW